MRKFIVHVLIASLLIGLMASVSFAETSEFSDIDKSYAKDAILELQAKGIINGMDVEHFNPQGTLTRAQFATIIVKSLGLETNATASSFTDVSGWAAPYVAAAYKAGIISGVGGGKFEPNATVTREMSATILVRALETKGALYGKDTLNFTDADKISKWAKPYIATAQKYGLIKGFPDGSFNPRGSASREMAAVMGKNLLVTIDIVINIGPKPDPTPTPIPTPEPTPTPVPTPDPTPPYDGGDDGIYTPPTVDVLTAYNTALAAVFEADYTVSSWGAYQLIVAENVVTSANTQAEVDVATSAIIAAQVNLIKPLAVGNITSGGPENYDSIPAIPTILVKDYTAKTVTVNELRHISMDVSVISGANEPPYFVMTATKGIETVHITSWFKTFDTPQGTENKLVWGQNVWEVTAGTGYALADVTHSNVAGGSGIDLLGEAFYDTFGEYIVTKVEVKMFGGPQKVEVINYAENYTDITAYNAALSAVAEAGNTTNWASYQTVVSANVVTVANTQAEVDAATLAITLAQGSLVTVGVPILKQEFVADALYGGYEIGYKIDLNILPYADIKSIQATLYDANQAIIAQNTADTTDRISSFETDDAGGVGGVADGLLTAFFPLSSIDYFNGSTNGLILTDGIYSDNYWIYNKLLTVPTTPTTATLVIKTDTVTYTVVYNYPN